MRSRRLEGITADSGRECPSKDRVARVIRRKLVAHGVLVRPAGAAEPFASQRIETQQRVLIADDYSDAAESLAVLLDLVGVETQIATRGDDALLKAMRWRPHTCVLDIDMPGRDGCEVARALRRQQWAHRPLLIALTGWTSADERARSLEAGFDYYFIKPVEPARLVRIIEQGFR